MATDGQIVEIVDRQSTQPDVALNVYHYRVSSGLLTISAATIAQVWWEDCNDVIRNLQTEELLHIRVTCRNLDNPADYGEYLIPLADQPGLNPSSDAMPRQDAVGVTFRGETVDTRPGSKRICGVPEAQSGEWGLLVPAYLSLVEDYAAHMSSQINSLTPAFVLDPVIVGFPNDDRPVRVENNIVGYTINPYVTTQNTRKIGRGA